MAAAATPPRQQRRSPRRAPRPLSARVRRRARRMWKPLRKLSRSLDLNRRGHKGVERPPHWTWPRAAVIAGNVVTWLGAIVLVALVARSFVIVLGGNPGRFPFGFDPDEGCRDIGYSCGVTNSMLLTFLSVSFGATLYLLFRSRVVRHAYVRRAKTQTRELVQTAGTIIGDVVGRDEICNVLLDDLRDRNRRRPHVVQGGVGIGKTAVLFQLTKLLADRGAVPVPIRLRDAEQDLDFVDLAHKRFKAEATIASMGPGEVERVWTSLRKDDQIVVLADGLEEALNPNSGNGDDEDTERDNRIRTAVRQARRQGLPLVIASRPHDALVGLDAAMIELEPLGEEAALEYIEKGATTRDEHRLDWVIETAEVTETPLYLQIAHELHEKGLLENAHPPRERLSTRGMDRAALRVGLLEAWIEALIAGEFQPQLPIPQSLRAATVSQLAALACIGMRKDRLEAKFADLTERRRHGGYVHQPLIGKLSAQIHNYRTLQQLPGDGFTPDIEREIRLAAARGARLGLVEPCRDGVRFPHSLMQAYLASRVIRTVIEENVGYLDKALETASRELLLALVMESRRGGENAPRRSHHTVRDALCRAVRKGKLNDAKRLDVLTAALEIDSVDRRPHHRRLVEELRATWPPSSDDQTVEEAKLRAIARFGAVARSLDQRRRTERRLDAPAYLALYRIACRDQSYRVRLAAAQELGAGGATVLEELTRERLKPPDGPSWHHPVAHRELVIRAWLVPMLYGSLEDEDELGRPILDEWVSRVTDRSSGPSLPLSLEIALAQGFKQAANRREMHPCTRREARELLGERAVAMLGAAQFWFSRLTLVQALCLWALEEPGTAAAQAKKRRRIRASKEAGDRSGNGARGRGADPRALVGHWLSTPAPGREHPFVAEARELATLALERGEPERFLWIDETGVATRIGARPPRADALRKHNLWIPPSAGWGALHPRAQRLVADVLILLNLAERSPEPEVREQRLRRAARDDLPPCLSGEREYLDPGRTVGTARLLAPGMNCKQGCAFDLCPYPEKGANAAYRVELSEAFCRRQRVLLGRWWRVFPRRTARWQGAVPRDLKRFWTSMEERARW